MLRFLTRRYFMASPTAGRVSASTMHFNGKSPNRIQGAMKIPAMLFGICICVGAHAQKIATFEVDISRATSGIDMPVSLNLDPVTIETDSLLSLALIDGSKRTPVAFQVSGGTTRMIHWTVPADKLRGKKLSFELSKGKPTHFEKVLATRSNGELTVRAGDRNFLRY